MGKTFSKIINIYSGRHRITEVDMLDVKNKTSQFCIVDLYDIYDFGEEFMNKNIHISNRDYINFAHSVTDLSDLINISRLVFRINNMELKILYYDKNTKSVKYIPKRYSKYCQLCKSNMANKVAFVLVPKKCKDRKAILSNMKSIFLNYNW